MRRQLKLSSMIAWFLCAATCLVALISLGVLIIQNGQTENTLKLVGDALWILLPVPFAITAALILSRLPGNVIGWLLVTPAILSIVAASVNNYFNSLSAPPVNPGIPFLVMVWFSNWDWLFLIFPVILIPFLFPTGRPPSARWRWVLILAAGLCITFLFVATFSKTLSSTGPIWSVANPIGFLDDTTIQTFISVWQVGLIVTIISCAASLFVRYRKARHSEREQIKWLLYAMGVFAVFYIPGFWIDTSTDQVAANLFNLLFNIAILAFPAAITIAILNYRLWDIDLVIRKTLMYSVLTGGLALVFFGSVALMGQFFRLLTGQASPLAVVLST